MLSWQYGLSSLDVVRDYPKSGLDSVEMVRMLKMVRSSAIEASAQASEPG